MSEAEFTGSQFSHHLNVPIDPRLLQNDQLEPGNQIHYAHFNQEFERDVEQAVRSRDDQSQWPASLENVPITPTNLSTAGSSLNPRALPFHPQPPPETTYRYRATELFQRPELTGTQSFAPYYALPDQVQGSHFNAVQHQQWPAPPTELNIDRLTQHNSVANFPVLLSPFAPRRSTAGPRENGGQLQYATRSPLAQMSAQARVHSNHRNAHNTGDEAALRVSSENVARVPGDQSPYQSMQQWNQDTYQGPVAHPLQPQFPPTPASSVRHRRVGSVAASTLAGSQTFPCNGCDKTFSKRCDLNHHRRWHTKSLICAVCDKPFTAEKDLRRHISTVHNKAEKHLFCNILGCKYSHIGFGRIDHLKRHHGRKHPEYPWSPPATSAGGG